MNVFRKVITSRTAEKSRLFSVCSQTFMREIVITEKGKTITVEGVERESERKNCLINPEFLRTNSCDAKENCHSLCQFDKVHEIKHTDVLILEQFVDNNGKIISRDVTGLCERQHFRMNKLIGMAQKSGLMGTKDKFAMEKSTKPWTNLNCYWDEKTIDVQWHNCEGRKKRRPFVDLS